LAPTQVDVDTNTNTSQTILFHVLPSLEEHQNYNTCPTCLALPGALPVANRGAITKAMKFGYAINADVNLVSYWIEKAITIQIVHQHTR